MAQQRIKGQEVSILISVDDDLQTELTDIQNFNIELDIELLEQGYLGEGNSRYDEIFKGAKFDFEMHTHSQDCLVLAQAVLDRASRKTPNTVFNIVATLSYPNGDTPVVTLPDCHFGALPINIPGRTEYVKIKVQGAVGTPDLKTS